MMSKRESSLDSVLAMLTFGLVYFSLDSYTYINFMNVKLHLCLQCLLKYDVVS